MTLVPPKLMKEILACAEEYIAEKKNSKEATKQE